MGDFIGQVVLLHAERKRNSYFRFETGKDKIQYQIGTTRHRNTRSSQLVPIIILENHICDICLQSEILVRHMVFVGNIQKSPIASHLKGLDPSLDFCYQGPALTGIKEGI